MLWCRERTADGMMTQGLCQLSSCTVTVAFRRSAEAASQWSIIFEHIDVKSEKSSFADHYLLHISQFR